MYKTTLTVPGVNEQHSKQIHPKRDESVNRDYMYTFTPSLRDVVSLTVSRLTQYRDVIHINRKTSQQLRTVSLRKKTNKDLFEHKLQSTKGRSIQDSKQPGTT